MEISLLATAVGPVAATALNGLGAACVAVGFGFLPELRRRIGTRDMGDLAVEEAEEAERRA